MSIETPYPGILIDLPPNRICRDPVYACFNDPSLPH